MFRNFLKNKLYVIILALTILTAILTTASFAWLATYKYEKDFSAISITNYFAGGTGAENDPYIINQPIHLYNLSWLQNKGIFDDENVHFLIGDATINHNSVTIDMAGRISGNGENTGAIPPIGTYDHPFTGHIDGNGSTIKNLWVSTDIDDWIEQPDAENNAYTSTHVGLFGAIGENAVVENFILDRIEVKSTINEAVVGILCGYVDARLTNVGVFNGIITIDGVQNTSSNYSIIGDMSSMVLWDEMPTISTDGSTGPGGTGGELVVDPSKLTGNVTGTQSIEGALSGTAYFSTVNLTNAPNSAMHDMTNNATSITNNTNSVNNYLDSITDTIEKKRMEDAFEVVFKNNAKMLYTTDTPFSSTASNSSPKGYNQVTGENNTTIKIPKYGVWFKPKTAGITALAFGVTNMSSDRYMMVYKMRRIDNNTVSLVDTTEFKFTKGLVSNKRLVYFEYTITQDDIDNEYEFIIGQSCVSGHTVASNQQNNVGFSYFKLAGTDTHQGDIPGGGSGGDTTEHGLAKYIKDIDYITMQELTTLPNTSPINVSPIIRTLIAFDKEVTGNNTISEKIYYLAVGTTTENTMLNYCATSSVITPEDVSADHKSNTANRTIFYARKETLGEDAYLYLT